MEPITIKESNLTAPGVTRTPDTAIKSRVRYHYATGAGREVFYLLSL